MLDVGEAAAEELFFFEDAALESGFGEAGEDIVC